MKQFKLGLLALTILVSVQTTQAQTVDEIVNKNITAMGGKEKLATLKTVRMEGLLNTQGTDVNLVITRSTLVGQRIDISAMGMDGYRINTPTAGWNFMPFMGQTSPEAMKDDQIKAGIAVLDIQGNLFNYKDKGTTVEFLGMEKVDSADCYKLKATLKSGKVMTYFIDTKTNYVVKTVNTQNLNGKESEVASIFSNYKPTADGYIFPWTNIATEGQIDFSKIEANVPVDAKIFTSN